MSSSKSDTGIEDESSEQELAEDTCTERTGMRLGRNSSESTLVPEHEDSRGVEWYDCQAREKRQRVAEFLTHRGHLPNCPLVQLQ